MSETLVPTASQDTCDLEYRVNLELKPTSPCALPLTLEHSSSSTSPERYLLRLSLGWNSHLSLCFSSSIHSCLSRHLLHCSGAVCHCKKERPISKVRGLDFAYLHLKWQPLSKEERAGENKRGRNFLFAKCLQCSLLTYIQRMNDSHHRKCWSLFVSEVRRSQRWHSADGWFVLRVHYEAEVLSRGHLQWSLLHQRSFTGGYFCSERTILHTSPRKKGVKNCCFQNCFCLGQVELSQAATLHWGGQAGLRLRCHGMNQEVVVWDGKSIPS